MTKTANKKSAQKKPAKKFEDPADGMRVVIAAVREVVTDNQTGLYEAAQGYLGAQENEALRGDKAASLESDKYDGVTVLTATLRSDGAEAYVAKLRSFAPAVKTRVLDEGQAVKADDLADDVANEG